MSLGPGEVLPRVPLEELFDRRVGTAHAIPALVDAALFPEERALVARAVPKRRAEFGVGRVCARRALATLGIAARPLLTDEYRAPIWPAGVVGSITHTDGYCAVVVARASDARGVGLDAERDLALDGALEEMICTPVERRWLDTQAPEERGRLGMLIFSAKEAFYKCQHPITKAYLDFRDVELAVWLDLRRFEIAAIRWPGAPLGGVQGVRGRFCREGGLILTGATL